VRQLQRQCRRPRRSWIVFADERLQQLGCSNATGVDFGSRADRTDARDAAARYANKRAEMGGFMKEWLKVGSLPDDPELWPT
jgi:hypothetical protein